MRYLDFVDAAGYTLTPAQRAFTSFAFDGELITKGKAGQASARLWGANVASGKAKPNKYMNRVVAAVCGRGSGKSLLGGTRITHLAATVNLDKLDRHELAICPIVAPDMKTARQVLRFALGAAERVSLPIEDESQEGFTIVRKGGRVVRIETRSASVRGSSVRGFSMPCGILDECAFFRDSATGKINDEAIFDALRPRLLPGGQIILLSSPWSEVGLLYDLWKNNYNHPIDALVAHAPTSLMRSDDEELMATIEALRKTDPEKCAREYDAEFMTANERMFFDPRAINSALIELPTSRAGDDTVGVGGDFAFRRNSSAFIAVASKGNGDRRVYEVRDILELAPHGRALKPSEVCSKAAKFASDAGDDVIIADGHYRESVSEHLWNDKITLTSAPEGASGKSEVFQATRQVLHEGQLKIPKTLGAAGMIDKLIRQLREVTSRPQPGGGMTIESPLWASGEHGDLVSALVLAVWRCYRMGWTPATKEIEVDIDPIERELMERDRESQERDSRLARLTGLSPLSRR